MINVKTILKVVDNSGAIFVSCIKTSKLSSLTKGSKIGDIITVVVKKNRVKKNIKKSKEIKKGQICKGVILATKVNFKRWGNFFVKSDSNCITLINKYFLPLGSRINSPVFREISSNPNFSKILSISRLSL